MYLSRFELWMYMYMYCRYLSCLNFECTAGIYSHLAVRMLYSLQVPAAENMVESGTCTLMRAHTHTHTHTHTHSLTHLNLQICTCTHLPARKISRPCISVEYTKVLFQSLNLAAMFVRMAQHFRPGQPPFIPRPEHWYARSITQSILCVMIILSNACSFKFHLSPGFYSRVCIQLLGLNLLFSLAKCHYHHLFHTLWLQWHTIVRESG